ncbi:MAG TPA: GNAT family N-acetyltransferase [Kofleriaceae bacterium]|nr:GNAT family N-acetyltransferase [Kofleriaceae bacterium]
MREERADGRTMTRDAIDIELACADDVADMVALANRAAETGTANFATEPEPVASWQREWANTRELYPWLVARAGGRVAGFAKIAPHRSRGAYRWTAEMSVYVDEAWHGRGIGSALYRILIPLARAQGYVTLLAGITAGHTASERLHQRAGFVRCGTYHRAGWKFGAWHDVGYWELHLSPPDRAPDPIRRVDEMWTARAIARPPP